MECFLEPTETVALPQSRCLNHIMVSPPVNCKSDGPSCVSVFSGYVWKKLILAGNTTGFSMHLRSLLVTEGKCASVSAEVEKISVAEFVFSTRKPLFLGMRRFHTLFEETVTFAYIYFLCYFLFLFPFNPYKIRMSAEVALRSIRSFHLSNVFKNRLYNYRTLEDFLG